MPRQVLIATTGTKHRLTLQGVSPWHSTERIVPELFTREKARFDWRLIHFFTHPRGQVMRQVSGFAPIHRAIVVLATAFAFLLLSLSAGPVRAADQTDTVRFGAQPWPGVTVKTEVANQLLQALGYDTKKVKSSTSFILNGMATGSLDVDLGGWYPISAAAIDPMVKSGKIVRLTANLSHALSGMAVPMYVHEAGVDSVDDLNKYADHFQHKVYGIEAGSTWNIHVKDAIKADKYDLSGWHVVQTSTAAMLAQVGRSIERKEWIVFYGWKPHWMNITYDLYFLKAPDDSKVAHTESTVYTLISPKFAEKNPNLKRFFKQLKVDTKVQSLWIYAYSYKKQPLEKIASKWIAENPDEVKQWLDDVTTRDGKPAFAAVEKAFSS